MTNGGFAVTEKTSPQSMSCGNVSHEATDVEDEEEEDNEVVYSQYTPYEDEPRAEDEEDDGEDEEADVDGLSPAVLESRYERTVPVNSWFI